MPGRLCRLVTIVLLCIVLFCLPIGGVGETFYAARFDEYKELWEAGVRLGTASGKSTTWELDGGEVWLTPSGGAKAYLLLPDVTTKADTYVVEFSFRFTDISASNGYIGFLLASQGEMPSGRTELLFRVNGTVDGYITEENEMQKQAASSGESITIRALVYYGYMMDFRVLIDGKEIARATPATLVRVDPTGWGFVVRNATAAISSIRAVAGGYEDLAAADPAPVYRVGRPVVSPPTGDSVWLWGTLIGMTGIAWILLKKSFRRHSN